MDRSHKVNSSRERDALACIEHHASAYSEMSLHFLLQVAKRDVWRLPITCSAASPEMWHLEKVTELRQGMLRLCQVRIENSPIIFTEPYSTFPNWPYRTIPFDLSVLHPSRSLSDRDLSPIWAAAGQPERRISPRRRCLGCVARDGKGMGQQLGPMEPAGTRDLRTHL